MTRAEKVAEARLLRAQGLTYREIGERMGGYKRSTVDAWLNDPDGSRLRARKDSYRGTCEDCGAPTNGSDGRGPNAPHICARCSGRRAGALRREYFLPQRQMVERLWALGVPGREIAARVGIEGIRSQKQYIAKCRSAGYDLPHRYSPERVARMTIGADERMAKARAVAAANRKAAA